MFQHADWSIAATAPIARAAPGLTGPNMCRRSPGVSDTVPRAPSGQESDAPSRGFRELGHQQSLPAGKGRSAPPPHWIAMTLVKDVVTVVPTLVLSAVAVLGIAVLIGLSSWDLPIGYDD